MIKMALLTGFLGAGKTTLLKEILTGYEGTKVGVIVNEFGEVNIDAKLIAKETGDGIEMAELSNGSIFCACIQDKFVDSLIEMSTRDLDYLFIEASGLADPSSINRILDGIRHKLQNDYDYKGSVCVIDGETFVDLYEMLPAITSQLEFCGAAVINKADLINEEQLGEIMEIVKEINPAAATYVTSYCRIDVRDVVENLVQSPAIARDSSNTYETRPVTFIVKGIKQVPLDGLKNLLEAVCPDAYRVKGFADTDEGSKEISAVGKNINVNDWQEPVEKTEIVVISAVGVRMMSILTKAIKDNLEGFVRL
ncbi:MAG: CobW family GTP-binding protein [Lentihominibacter sp.]